MNSHFDSEILIEHINMLNKHKKKINSLLTTSVHSYLENRVSNPVAFCSMLKKYNAYLGGSAVTQMLTGDSLKESDLDIFVLSKGHKQEPQYIIENIFDFLSKGTKDRDFVPLNLFKENFEKLPDSKIWKSMFTKIDNKMYLTKAINYYSTVGCILHSTKNYHSYYEKTKYYDNYPIVKVNSYVYTIGGICKMCKKKSIGSQFKGKHIMDCVKCSPKSTKIQIIQIDPEEYSSIPEFIKTVDFDFCKGLFDGKTFILSDEVIKSIITKRCKYVETYNPVLNEQRRLKYEKRGYTFF